MTEKANFFYKETPQGRVDLQDAFTNALLGDVKINSPVESRQIKIK
jgi:hypothetical protein